MPKWISQFDWEFWGFVAAALIVVVVIIGGFAAACSTLSQTRPSAPKSASSAHGGSAR